MWSTKFQAYLWNKYVQVHSSRAGGYHVNRWKTNVLYGRPTRTVLCHFSYFATNQRKTIEDHSAHVVACSYWLSNFFVEKGSVYMSKELKVWRVVSCTSGWSAYQNPRSKWVYWKLSCLSVLGLQENTHWHTSSKKWPEICTISISCYELHNRTRGSRFSTSGV